MDQDDPEKRIADLERQLAEPCGAGDPGANRGSQQRGAFTPPPQAGSPRPTGGSALPTGEYLTSEQVRNVTFSKPPLGKRGYNIAEVDMFLDLVEAALRDPTARILTPKQVRTIAFSKPPLGKRGYNEAEVDAFLDRVEGQMQSRQGAAPPSPQAGFPSQVGESERQQAEAVGRPPQFPDAHRVSGRQTVAPEEPIRCVLIEIFSRRRLWRNALRLDFSGGRPALAMDVSKDAIRVTDLTTNSLVASARLAQVTATPKEHTDSRQWFGSLTIPVLVVGVPGLPALTVGPLPLGVPPNWARRGRYASSVASSWRTTVPTTFKYPTHLVTNAEWLSLVEKFGLAPQLNDRTNIFRGPETERQSGSS